MIRPKRLIAIPLVVTVIGLTSMTGCSAHRNSGPNAPTSPASTPPISAAEFEAIGDAARNAGDFTRAEQYYSLAVSAGGDARNLTFKMIAACTADARYLLAKDHARDYVRKHPEDTAVRYVLASLELATGDADKARLELERVIAEAPTMANAHYALASVIHSSGRRSSKADEHFKAYLKLAPRGEFADQARASLSRGAR